MDEIVAAKIGAIITNSPKQIAQAVLYDREIHWLTRQHMAFMAAMDLGIKWEKLADSRTLFIIDDGEIKSAPEKRKD